MRTGRLLRLLATGTMALAGVAGVAYGLHPSGRSESLLAAHTTAAPVFDGRRATVIDLESPTAYKPVAAPGTWDDYHCTLLNPHVTTSSFIVASQFYPGSIEVHHSILFLVPPQYAHAAEVANHDGKGWSCFGEAPIPGTSRFQFASTPWLSAWGPGAPENIEPSGTGLPLPAGSLVIMQIHYNLLLGNKPVRSRMQLVTVPASTRLKPISLALYPAPPDIPCPSGVHGPLCTRAASLAYTGRQFGQSEINFINLLETVCGRDPVDPPGGDSTSCTWPIGRSGYIVRIAAHMHLLGVSMTVTLNPGTPEAKVLLNVPHYDFNYQRSYDMAKPVRVIPSDRIKVACTYNPRLRQEIPYLRDLPPQYITWGDGSADEMCLAIVSIIPPS
jgi:Copper type II ascorbate-dependent monooxygenase, C-terminal domain